MRQWLCWASREKRIRRRHYVFQKHITQPLMPLKATSRCPNATVEPLRATESHCRATSRKKKSALLFPFRTFLESHSEPLRATEKSGSFLIPSSRVTGSSTSKFADDGSGTFTVEVDRGPFVPCARRFCSRIVLGRAGALVSCCARSPHQNQQHTWLTKTCYTPIAAHRNHGLMWCSLVGSVARLRALSSTGAITTDVKGVTERCFFDRRRGCSSGCRGSPASLPSSSRRGRGRE